MDREQEKLLIDLENYMNCQRLTAKEIAVMLGVTPNTITNWRKGGAISIGKQKQIARLIEDYADEGARKRPPEVSFDVPKPQFAPLLTVAQAASIRPTALGLPIIGDNETSGFINVQEGDFAVVIAGRSMMPWYPPGTHVLVRRSETPKTGDRVVAMLADSAEPVFKVFIDNGSTFTLLSINEEDGLPPITLNKMDREEWYWCYPIVESKRNERMLDAAMHEFGIEHFWQRSKTQGGKL